MATAQPGSSGHQGGQTWTDLPFHFRMQLHTHPYSLTMGQFRHTNSSHMPIFGTWGEYPEKIYKDSDPSWELIFFLINFITKWCQMKQCYLKICCIAPSLPPHSSHFSPQYHWQLLCRIFSTLKSEQHYESVQYPCGCFYLHIRSSLTCLIFPSKDYQILLVKQSWVH